MTSTQLQNVRVHGLGLTDDFLLQLSERSQTGKIEGATPASYGLPPHTSLEEAVQDAWDDARKAWEKYQKYPSDPWASWVRPLLKALDYSYSGQRGSGKYAPLYLSETGDVPLHYAPPTGPANDLQAADLDRVTLHGNGEGTLRTSPHGLMQGYLNATSEHLWGLVTNGEQLRLLRDNAQVTRAAYVEFNIADMMRSEDARAFRVLWLLLHRSRLKGAEKSPLEAWNTRASSEGVKARDSLRNGVEQAINHLGTGFLQANPDLLALTREDAQATTDVYRTCLKLVYQLVFLFVTEDRDLLFGRNGNGEYIPDAQTRDRARHYLTRALRDKATALTGNTLHFDAYACWERLLAYMREGFAPLGLPALGSHLFALPERPELQNLRLSNRHFYEAIRALSEITVDGNRRPVNYAGLDSEELGSIYESLLELVPRIQPGPRFELQTLAGNERKTTGSYYTPSSLIGLLLESALDPVIEDAIRDKLPEDAIAALKGLKIIDPACGSGHFLIAAARRIGARLAELEEETSQPSPRALRKATRTVIAHCIYGADINPMAIELAKVALWLESQDAGKPLAFLDHRLRVGNSLLGTTPELMTEITRSGNEFLVIPDDAFTALEGDDRKYSTAVKKRNKTERGQSTLSTQVKQVAFESSAAKELDAMPDDTLEQVTAKAKKFETILSNPKRQKAKFLADAWCSAFMWPKYEGAVQPVTTDVLNALAINPDDIDYTLVAEKIREIANKYRFLHPHIEFPDVFDHGGRGFDCVLGNPPWETLEASQESEDVRHIKGIQNYINHSGRYKKTSGGKNLYLFFTEFSLSMAKEKGRVGYITPTEIVQSKPAEEFARYIVSSKALITLYDFENRGIWFPAIDSRYRFSLITLSKSNQLASKFVFDVDDLLDITNPERSFNTSFEIVSAASPSRFSVPAFKIGRDADIFLSTAARVRMMADDTSEISGTLMFNFSPSDNATKVQSHGERTDGYYNVYDGENIHQFEWARKGANTEGKPFCTEFLMPIGHVNNRLVSLFGGVPNWILGLRRQARGNDSFVGISAFIPVNATEGSLSVLVVRDNNLPLAVITNANLNTFAFNYLLALRISGPNVNKGVYEQVPIIFNAVGQIIDTAYKFTACRVLELTYTAYDLTAFARDLGYGGDPFIWNDERRFWLRAELDALYFILYGIARDDVDYIMDTFPIVKRKDEAAYGSYRTKEAILSVYDELQTLKLENIAFYETRAPGGEPAGGWKPGEVEVNPHVSPLVKRQEARDAILELLPHHPELAGLQLQNDLYRHRATRSGQNSKEDWVNYIIEYLRD